MSDILDGKYTGKLTPEQVIEQYKYRIQIHETYAGLVVEDPIHYPPENYGTYEFQLWAIGGYKWGINYIEQFMLLKLQVEELKKLVKDLNAQNLELREGKLTIGQAVSFIIKTIIHLIRR